MPSHRSTLQRPSRSGAEPLRVALVQTQAENAGAQEISRLVARGLEARGHTVRQVFFFRRTASFDDVANAVTCCRERPSGLLAFTRFLLRLRALLKRMRPDVVVTFQHFGNLVGAPVARSVGVKRIIANQSTATAMLGWPLRTADLMLGVAGSYDAVVVNSAETARDYDGHPRRYRDRLCRIDHGFEDKSSLAGRREAREALGLPRDVTLLGCAARLHPGKQLDAAIRVLTRNAGHHLALAGQGAEAPKLAALAEDLGVESRVHFLGELAPERIGLFLAALDCFVFPSAYESFGLAPVEAAQAGVPVVANRIQVLEEVLSVDGEPCASFVDVRDTDAFAEAVRRILADPALAGTFRARARGLRDRYPMDGMVQSYVALVEAHA